MDRYTIGKKITAVRKSLGLRQDEFGELLGVAKQTVSRWERGRTLPDIIMLVQIAAMCGLTLNDFIENPIIELHSGITEKEFCMIQQISHCKTQDPASNRPSSNHKIVTINISAFIRCISHTQDAILIFGRVITHLKQNHYNRYWW